MNQEHEPRHGPWGPPRQPEPPAPRRQAPPRMLLWLLFIGALVALVVALAHAFPGGVQTKDGWASVAYSVGFAALVAAGLLRAGRGGFAQHARHIGVWAVIVAVLALGVAYFDDLEDLGRRVQLAFSPGQPVVMGARQVAILKDDSGAFTVWGKVDGQPVRFVVDTGATDTVLSPADARRIGVDLAKLRYSVPAETANGVGFGARLPARLEVGAIGIDGFPLVVNQAPMSRSLLGMNFLNRLESFEVRGRRLILRAKS